MTILTQTTNYSEANSGDTTNPGANFGNVSQGNWPLLGFDSSGKAVFSGTFSSSSDSDFFAIDVAGGTHDWSGSLGASAGFTVTVTLTGGGGTFTIQGRREDYYVSRQRRSLRQQYGCLQFLYRPQHSYR